MLMVCVPDGEYAGTATINGESVVFKVQRTPGPHGEFWYRPKGPASPWDKRKVLSRQSDGTLTQYICVGEDGSGTVIDPVADLYAKMGLI